MTTLPSQRHLRIEQVQADLLTIASQVASSDIEVLVYRSTVPVVALIDVRRLWHYRYAVEDLAKLRADGDVIACWCSKGDESFRKELVKSGRLVATHIAARQLRVSRKDLAAAVSEQRMFTVKVDDYSYLPAFFLIEEVERRKIEVTYQVLRELPGWSVWEFFTLPKNSLWGYTPLDALRRGLVDSVKEAAEAFTERSLHRITGPDQP